MSEWVTRSSLLLWKYQREVLLLIMYTVDISRDLSRVKQELCKHNPLDYSAVRLLHMGHIMICRWGEDTQIDSGRAEQQHFCDSAPDLLHLYCLHNVHRSDLSASWIICQGIMARKQRMLRVCNNTSHLDVLSPRSSLRQESKHYQVPSTLDARIY